MRTSADGEKAGEREIVSTRAVVRLAADPLRSTRGVARHAVGAAAFSGASEVIPLQRMVGNRAVAAMLGGALQRQADTAADEESEDLAGGTAPRELEEDDAAVQRQEAAAAPAEPGTARGAASPAALPDGLRRGVESLSGLSLDDVRVHYDSPAPARVGALAYAQGTDIHLATGQEEHLPHEAWHVAQQKQGRVQATLHVAGTPVNDDAALEREADVMGKRAAG